MECEISENTEPGNSNESCTIKCEVMQQEKNDGEENSAPETMLKNSPGLTTPEDKQLNRRFTLRPRKCLTKEIGGSLRRVMKKTYTRCLNHQQLETIFEEPIVTKQGELVFIGLSKAKRSITFSQFVTKTKLKKRNIKAKKLREKLIAERKKMEDVESKLWKLGL